MRQTLVTTPDDCYDSRAMATMHMAIRHGIRVVAITLFFVLAPGIILYSMGFRYDFDERVVRKVGLMIIESEPKAVTVFVNDKNKAERTPHRATSLSQGTYDIRLEKEGYATWEKTLFVESRFVTWVRDVVLFKQHEPETIVSNRTFVAGAPGPEGSAAFVATNEDGTRSILYLDKGEELKEIRLSELHEQLLNFMEETAPRRIEWDAAADAFLVIFERPTGGDDVIFVVRDGSEVTDVVTLDSLIAPADTVADAADMDMRSGNVVIYKAGEIAIRATVGSETTETVAEDALAIGSQDGSIGIVRTDGRVDVAKPRILGSNELSFVTAGSLPEDALEAEAYDIVLPHETNGQNVAFALADKTLFALMNANDPIRLHDDIRETALSPTEEGVRIAYRTEFEVGFAAFDKELPVLPDEQLVNIPAYEQATPTLLARYSEPIRSFAWHPEGTHLAIQLDDRIVIVEIDGRDRRNAVEIPIIRGTAVPFVAFDKKGERLFVLTDNGLTSKRIAD